MQLLLIDNYDSFTYNLYDYLMRLGARVEVHRNDAIALSKIGKMGLDGIVLSPGPERPAKAGLLMDIIASYHQQLPILGICLGHQAIGEFFGADLVKAKVPIHGKTSAIAHDNSLLFQGIAQPMQVMRYHSLILDNLPDCLVATAHTSEGEIMALEHRSLPLFGVQFHPESILSPEGLSLLQNWLQTLKSH
jgi:anthranilate synthase/aminodeoxychorismate synthase-like glutamine amidotransferase